MQNISNLCSSLSTKNIAKVEDRVTEKEHNINVDDNLEQFDYSKRFRSVYQKKNHSIMEKEVRRKETMSSDKLEEQQRHLNKNDSLENIRRKVFI